MDDIKIHVDYMYISPKKIVTTTFRFLYLYFYLKHIRMSIPIKH